MRDHCRTKKKTEHDGPAFLFWQRGTGNKPLKEGGRAPASNESWWFSLAIIAHVAGTAMPKNYRAIR